MSQGSLPRRHPLGDRKDGLGMEVVGLRVIKPSTKIKFMTKMLLRVYFHKVIIFLEKWQSSKSFLPILLSQYSTSARCHERNRILCKRPWCVMGFIQECCKTHGPPLSSLIFEMSQETSYFYDCSRTVSPRSCFWECI